MPTIIKTLKRLISRFYKPDQYAPHKTGLQGEIIEARHLKQHGYRILATRYRRGAHEEIDIIARQHNVLVFVEVKTRKSTDYGRPFSAVTKSKHRALSRAAVHYMQRLRNPPEHYRFDVIEVVGENPVSMAIHHIEKAFLISSYFPIDW
jgi:putative endonuclease